MSDSVTELPAKPDLPLGVDDGVVYMVRDYVVQTGSMLFLYTDGLTEAMNAQREQFGRKRLTDSLKSSLNCKDQINEMTQAVHEFVNNAPQSDDLTMLAIKVKSEESGSEK